jgi:hypothetical protein
VPEPPVPSLLTLALQSSDQIWKLTDWPNEPSLHVHSIFQLLDPAWTVKEAVSSEPLPDRVSSVCGPAGVVVAGAAGPGWWSRARRS